MKKTKKFVTALSAVGAGAAVLYSNILKNSAKRPKLSEGTSYFTDEQITEYSYKTEMSIN